MVAMLLMYIATARCFGKVYSYHVSSIDCPGTILTSDPDHNECIEEALGYKLISINETNTCHIESCESKLFVWDSEDAIVPGLREGIVAITMGFTLSIFGCIGLCLCWYYKCYESMECECDD